MNNYVQCSIVYNSQDLEAAQVSISRWVEKKANVMGIDCGSRGGLGGGGKGGQIVITVIE